MNGLVLAGDTLGFLGRNGRPVLRRAWPVLMIAGCVLAAEWFVLSRLHTLFPGIVASAFAPFLAAAVTGGFLFLRLITIGAGALLLYSLTGAAVRDGTPARRRAWWQWCLVAAIVASLLFAIDAVQIDLQFRGSEPLDPIMGIVVTLMTYYGQVVVLGLAACLFVACLAGLADGREDADGFWRFSRGHRFALLVGALIIYLVVEKIVLPVLLYLPFIAPFWTMTGELSEVTHYTVRIVTVIAQSLSVLIYAAFAVTACAWVGHSRNN